MIRKEDKGRVVSYLKMKCEFLVLQKIIPRREKRKFMKLHTT
jgi:hypothetical protein